MDMVTVSPKFQIVIPRAIRQALDIRPDQCIQAIRYGDRIELIPLHSTKSARGFLGGINSGIAREKDRL